MLSVDQLGVVGEAEQLRALGAQPEHVERDRPGVVCASAAPARALRLRQPAPDIAVGQRGQVRVRGREDQRDQLLAVEPSLGRGRGGAEISPA